MGIIWFFKIFVNWSFVFVHGVQQPILNFHSIQVSFSLGQYWLFSIKRIQIEYLYGSKNKPKKSELLKHGIQNSLLNPVVRTIDYCIKWLHLTNAKLSLETDFYDFIQNPPFRHSNELDKVVHEVHMAHTRLTSTKRFINLNIGL